VSYIAIELVHINRLRYPLSVSHSIPLTCRLVRPCIIEGSPSSSCCRCRSCCRSSPACGRGAAAGWGCTRRTGRSAGRRAARRSAWPGAWPSRGRRSPRPWSRRGGRLHHRRSQRGAPWRIGGRRACLVGSVSQWSRGGVQVGGEHLPSLRCLSSNIFMAMKEAPPATISWLSSALLSSCW
jgi:hypothetical protein